MITITDQDTKYAAELASMPRHFGAIPRRARNVAIDSTWRINVQSADDVAVCGAASLAEFLRRYCGLSLAIAVGEPVSTPEIRFRWKEGDGEGFAISMASQYVEVAGDSPAGALYGAHRLQWLMGMNGGAFLRPETAQCSPAVPVRIASTPFHQGFDDAGDPLTYSEGYLDLMAHYGINRLHMYVDVNDYILDMPDFPELESPEANGRIERLADLAQRASRYNIGIVLHPNTVRYPKDHPVFTSHPELKGATCWDPESHCFCSSEPLAVRIYGQALRNIVGRVPQVKGILAIVGGECFTHCYTRPTSLGSAGTDCPRCAKRAPSEVVAGYMNSLASAVWEEHPEVEFTVWPYSAFLWSESPEQKEFINLLDERVGFMTCLEKDAWLDIDGCRFSVFDYSINCIGPSDKCKVQSRLVDRKGMPFYVKTESSVALEMYNLPYIPVMNRWQKRWEGITSSSPNGVLMTWRFAGWSGTLSEELAYHEMWGTPGNENPLKLMAERLAGEEASAAVLNAWECFSEAFSLIPLTAGLSGFPYFRGPMYLGPAHPLIFQGEDSAFLPESFYRTDPTLVELYKGEELDRAPKRPLFFDDYRWTLPIGIRLMSTRLELAVHKWQTGLSRYQLALVSLNPERRDPLRQEIDVALMAATVLRSASNLAKFQTERENLISKPVRDGEVEEYYKKLHSIIWDDLENSKLGLELARKHYRFGYGFVYGKAFDAQMIEEKIKYTEEVLLPRMDVFFNILTSHAFARKFKGSDSSRRF